MASYKQIKEFQTAKGEQLQKNKILIPDWLTWMFHCIDFWTLVRKEVNIIIFLSAGEKKKCLASSKT